MNTPKTKCFQIKSFPLNVVDSTLNTVFRLKFLQNFYEPTFESLVLLTVLLDVQIFNSRAYGAFTIICSFS